jgi:hypothetical protein
VNAAQALAGALLHALWADGLVAFAAAMAFGLLTRA